MSSGMRILVAVIRRLAGALVVFLSATAVMFILFARSSPPHGSITLAPDIAGAGYARSSQPAVGGYLHWLARIFTRGDLGESEALNRTVSEIVEEGFSLTLSLAIGSLVASVVIAIPLGYISALRPDSAAAGILMASTTAVSAVPVFLLACFLRHPWVVHFGILGHTQAGTLRLLGYYVVPMVILGVGDGAAGEMAKQVRETVSSILGEQFVVSARARGAPLWRHVGKAIAIPIFAIVASRFSYALGGALIVEYIFFGHGISKYALDALIARDAGVILGIGVVFCALSVAAEFLHQALLVVGDPRVTRGGTR